jgi:hypothetical protein
MAAGEAFRRYFPHQHLCTSNIRANFDESYLFFVGYAVFRLFEVKIGEVFHSFALLRLLCGEISSSFGSSLE